MKRCLRRLCWHDYADTCFCVVKFFILKTKVTPSLIGPPFSIIRWCLHLLGIQPDIYAFLLLIIVSGTALKPGECGPWYEWDKLSGVRDSAESNVGMPQISGQSDIRPFITGIRPNSGIEASVESWLKKIYLYTKKFNWSLPHFNSSLHLLHLPPLKRSFISLISYKF